VPELIALTLPAGPRFVEAMQRVWDAGDAILPVDPRLPAPAIARLFASLRPSAVIDGSGERNRLDDGVPVAAGDAVVISTSGSTGEPKGVIHTHDSVAASARATSARLGVDPGRDRWLCCLPVAHVAGLSVVTRALHLGVDLEVHAGFDADAVMHAAKLGATLTTLVPTALARIDPAAFRRIVVGGAAPPSPLPPNAVVSYGLTETGSAIAYDGVALDGAEMRVADGEIQLRGPMLLRAYRGGPFPIEGHDPTDGDGWFSTDDGGTIDESGRVTVYGRRGELIITGGENVWPNSVERVLCTHPAVAEVAVVGRPDPEWGRRVVAVVVCRATPPSLDELRAHVKVELPAFAAPRELELVDALPRTLLGKVDRLELDRSRPGRGPAATES
jgi:O-succinylbenzoic acid--CoA ligase